MENSLKPNQCEILFEIARKKSNGKEISIPNFYTYERNEIYFKATHKKGKSPVNFSTKLQTVNHIQTLGPEMDLNNILKFELSNKVSVWSKTSIPFRFAVSGTYLFNFHILDEKGEREIPESELEIIPMKKTVTDEICSAYPRGSHKNQGRIEVIVLDYFSYKVRNLTGWLIGLTTLLIVETAILIYLTLKMLKLI